MSCGKRAGGFDPELRVLHVVPALDRKFGGPGWSVTRLCRALADAGARVFLVALDLGKAAPAGRLDPGPDVEVTLVRGWHFKRLGAVVSARFRTRLSDLVSSHGIQVIHDHGLWLQTNRDASLVAERKGIPLVAAPRGTLEPWSRRRKAWKKRLAWHLFQKRALDRASVLHATSGMEARNLRDLGLDQPIAVVPNAVELPRPPHGGFHTGKNQKARTALFLSRIHPKKGLISLVEAWAAVRPEGWRMLVVGPDENGHHSEVEAAVQKHGVGGSFEIRGPAFGAEKEKLWRIADLFILPTFSENFGIAVAEALAHEVPVITTRAAPWRDLEEHDCGWWVEVGMEPLAQALSEALVGRPPARLREMGRRGRTLVEEKYSWPRVAAGTLELYRWLLDAGPAPDHVLLEC